MVRILFDFVWVLLGAAFLYLMHELLDQLELQRQGLVVSTGTRKLILVISACLTSIVLLIVKGQHVPIPALAGAIAGTMLQICQPGLFRKI